MIWDRLIDLAAALVSAVIGWLPTVELPTYDLSPLLPIIQAPAALLPMSALVYCLTVALTLGAAHAVLAVVRFVRTVGAP